MLIITPLKDTRHRFLVIFPNSVKYLILAQGNNTFGITPTFPPMMVLLFYMYLLTHRLLEYVNCLPVNSGSISLCEIVFLLFVTWKHSTYTIFIFTKDQCLAYVLNPLKVSISSTKVVLNTKKADTPSSCPFLFVDSVRLRTYNIFKEQKKIIVGERSLRHLKDRTLSSPLR